MLRIIFEEIDDPYFFEKFNCFLKIFFFLDPDWLNFWGLVFILRLGTGTKK